MKYLATSILFLSLFSGMSGQVRSIYLEGHDDYQYTVKEIRVSPGEEIKLTLKTISSQPKMQMAHNWVLLKQDVDPVPFVNQGIQYKDNEYINPKLEDEIIAHTDLLGNGEQDTITFKAPEKKGEYVYVCTFPGHYALGMKGTFIVE
jgi:azurin